METALSRTIPYMAHRGWRAWPCLWGQAMEGYVCVCVCVCVLCIYVLTCVYTHTHTQQIDMDADDIYVDATDEDDTRSPSEEDEPESMRQALRAQITALREPAPQNLVQGDEGDEEGLGFALLRQHLNRELDALGGSQGAVPEVIHTYTHTHTRTHTHSPYVTTARATPADTGP
jgi:hypothetical protein